MKWSVSAAYAAVLVAALAHAPIAQVVALRETSVVFAACIGSIFLGESFGARRIWASAVVAAGLAVLTVASK